MEKKYYIIGIVIIVFMLLVVLFNKSFAYFAAYIKGNAEASTTRINTASIDVYYDDGAYINVNNIYPGWSAEKIITLKNNSKVPVYFNVIWKSVSNDYTSDNFVYSIEKLQTSGADNVGERKMPSTDNETVIHHQLLNQYETQKYKLTFKLKEINVPQDEDQAKTFIGTLFAEVKTAE